MLERNPNTIKLYNRILEQEQRLDQLRFDLASSIRAGDHNRLVWYECRHRLRLLYEEITRTDPIYVNHGSLLSHAWIRLYHGPVEQARVSMAKGGYDWEELRIEMMSLLDEGIGFFLLFSQFFDSKSERLTPRSAVEMDVLPSDISEKLAYECQLYLGDLYRYRYYYFAPAMQLTDLYLVDLDLSRRHYKRATEIISTNGHAWNQLAVLFSLQDSPIEACLYYARATMSIKPFGKSADNLLTMCRKLVSIYEEHLDLASSPIVAALYGMFLRLNSAAIVHELARNSLVNHMEAIVNSLGILFQKNYRDLWACLAIEELEPWNSQMVERLHSLTSLTIFVIEFLQKSSSSAQHHLSPSSIDIKERYFGRGQSVLAEWLFKLADRLLTLELDSKEKHTSYVGLTPVFLICVWLLICEDSISRSLSTASIINDDQLSSNPASALKDLLRTICRYVNTSNLIVSVKYDIFLGTRFASQSVPEGALENPLRSLAEHLCHKHLLLVCDEVTSNYVLREDLYRIAERQKRFQLFSSPSNGADVDSTTLSHQTLTRRSQPAHWHLCDSACLLEFWDRIEGLIKVKALCLIITLTNLRYLDHIKGFDRSSTRTRHARNIMRSIMAFDRAKEGQIYLQGPRENLNIPLHWKHPIEEVAKHQKSLLDAYGFFSEADRGFTPLILLVKEELMRNLLDSMQIDYVPDIKNYLNKL